MSDFHVNLGDWRAHQRVMTLSLIAGRAGVARGDGRQRERQREQQRERTASAASWLTLGSLSEEGTASAASFWDFATG